MPTRWVQQLMMVTAGSSFLLPTNSAQALAQQDSAQTKTHSKKIDPQINAQFLKGSIQDFVKRFETNDREVFARRYEIAEVLDLKPGMAVADIGAGTGVFTRLFADTVGPRGNVYAVDVSKVFLEHIAAEAKSRKQPQVITLLGTQTTTNLPAGSVDVAFLCDVYHHLEDHEKILASIHQALRPRGLVVLVEFDRVERKSSPFVLSHVRASQAEFRREVEAAGFKPLPIQHSPQLNETFIAKFQRVEKSQIQQKPKGLRSSDND
jgi:ubiquinone/menaquinone biosynthesis C-methylase UbiE